MLLQDLKAIREEKETELELELAAQATRENVEYHGKVRRKYLREYIAELDSMIEQMEDPEFGTIRALINQSCS